MYHLSWFSFTEVIFTDCGLINVSNGMVIALQTTYGANAEVFCDPGYNNVSSVICAEDGTWSNVDPCEPVGRYKWLLS